MKRLIYVWLSKQLLLLLNLFDMIMHKLSDCRKAFGNCDQLEQTENHQKLIVPNFATNIASDVAN